MPTSRGDLLWGIAEGFSNLCDTGLLTDTPRVHAVEPFARIAAVQRHGDYRELQLGQTDLLSIGGSTVGFQALEALRISEGTAIPVNAQQVQHDQRVLAQNGFYQELSGAASLSGARELTEAFQNAREKIIVCIGTSHGYKESQEFREPIELHAQSNAVDSRVAGMRGQ